MFELGRPVSKRRRFLESFGGVFPNSDGKLYPGDIDQILNITTAKKANAAAKLFWAEIGKVNESKLIKNKEPSTSAQKRIKEAGFDLTTHDYYQWKPDSIHTLLRNVSQRIENGGNVTMSFDNEVYNIIKNKDIFHISTYNGDFYCKNVIMCAGRSGWRWVNTMYKNLGILVHDDIVQYGARVEIPAQYMKDFNKSHCSLTSDDLIIGPLSWNGQVIQEDHADMTIASFRSNEDRWKSDKVFFSVFVKAEYPDKACFQTERIAKLGFLLAQDRVGRERIKTFLKEETQLSLIPEYFILKKVFEKLEKIFPQIINRGYFHYPDIYSILPNIRVSSNFETEIPGLFVAGESGGIRGLAGAGISGIIAADAVLKT